MTTASVLVLPVELHDPENGRLDARRSAGFLSAPLSRLARETGRKYQRLPNPPDAPVIQEALTARDPSGEAGS